MYRIQYKEIEPKKRPKQNPSSREELVDRGIRVLVLLKHLQRLVKKYLLEFWLGYRTFAIANSKSSCVTCCRRSRRAYMPAKSRSAAAQERSNSQHSPASVQIPRTSAPEHCPIFSASSFRLMPRCKDIFQMTTFSQRSKHDMKYLN